MSEIQIVVNDLAEAYRVDAKRLMAVVEVESAGRLFWSVGGKSVPPARPEAHYFHRRLAGAQQKQAVAQGLAHPKAGAISPPSSYAGVYGVIERMERINREAALESCSWGCGQVMGAHWRKLGYASVQQMVDANYTARGQVDCMLRYIDKFGLRDALQQGDTTKGSWAAFAKAYNGPAYARWGYHTKMAAAFRKHASRRYMEGSIEVSSREQYRLLQRDLKTLGYYKGSVDGLDGPETRRAIRSFQADNGLVEDARYGAMTERKVAEALAERKGKIDDRTLETGGALTGGGVAADKATDDLGNVGEQVIDTVGPLQWLGGETMQTIITVVMLLGVALVVYSLVRRMKR